MLELVPDDVLGFIPDSNVLREGNCRPVNQEQIDVLNLKVLQGILEILDCVGIVEGEKLSGDENILSLVLSLLEDGLQGSSDKFMVIVEDSSVYVSIASIESGSQEIRHCLLIFTEEGS